MMWLLEGSCIKIKKALTAARRQRYRVSKRSLATTNFTISVSAWVNLNWFFPPRELEPVDFHSNSFIYTNQVKSLL